MTKNVKNFLGENPCVRDLDDQLQEVNNVLDGSQNKNSVDPTNVLITPEVISEGKTKVVSLDVKKALIDSINKAILVLNKSKAIIGQNRLSSNLQKDIIPLTQQLNKVEATGSKILSKLTSHILVKTKFVPKGPNSSPTKV